MRFDFVKTNTGEKSHKCNQSKLTMGRHFKNCTGGDLLEIQLVQIRYAIHRRKYQFKIARIYMDESPFTICQNLFTIQVLKLTTMGSYEPQWGFTRGFIF